MIEDDGAAKGGVFVDMVVAGSLVVDMPVWLDRTPGSGETIVARDSGIFPGGKGFNQAVQAARLGARVLLVGMVGRDVLGDFLLDHAARELGTVDGIRKTNDALTSYATPVMEPGSHHIIHVPGANRRIRPEDIHATLPLWGGARWLLVQGEMADDAALFAMKTMAERGGTVVLDPAPVDGVTAAMLETADVITPNKTEFAQLVGADADTVNVQALQYGVDTLFQRWSRLQIVLVTLGSSGVFAATRSGFRASVPPEPVAEVDPTAAGDSFNGAWVWAMNAGRSLMDATALAARAGALTASRAGALPSLPQARELCSTPGS